jgi:hypothetical protein
MRPYGSISNSAGACSGNHRNGRSLQTLSTCRQKLGTAIDAAGAGLSREPSQALANAVARASRWVSPLAPHRCRWGPDSEVRQVLMRHRRLRKEFHQLTEPGTAA